MRKGRESGLFLFPAGALRSISATRRAPGQKESPPEDREARQEKQKNSAFVFRCGFGGLGGAGRLPHAGVWPRMHGSG